MWNSSAFSLLSHRQRRSGAARSGGCGGQSVDGEDGDEEYSHVLTGSNAQTVELFSLLDENYLPIRLHKAHTSTGFLCSAEDFAPEPRPKWLVSFRHLTCDYLLAA